MSQSTLPPRGHAGLGDSRRTQHWVAGQRETLGHDLYAGLLAWPMWSTLGWQDIRQRYRRSVLGPVWITLSMAILIGTLGVIYGRVFHTELQDYLPFLCVGFIVWGFISSSANECCTAFTASAGIIKQSKGAFSIHVLRVVWRNFIVFAHTFVIFVPVAIIFGVKPHPAMLLVLPGLVLLFLNSIWLGLVIAILSARFYDVPQIVANLLQVVFFSTPIIWQAQSLGDESLIAEINPIYHLVEVVRAPLLGRPPEPLSWIVTVAVLAIGFIAATALFRRVSLRIVYWI
jgi:ABC-type polysaccharide/polyol phosphate export permease